MTANGASGADRPGRPRISLDAVPTWLQAVAAVATVIVSAVALVVANNGPASGPEPSGSQGHTRRVVIETLLPEDDQVHATGVFERVNTTAEAVLLIGQPAADTSASWVPVEASMSPETRSADGTANGRWEAMRPVAAGVSYRWYAVVAPRVSGAGINAAYVDIGERGPDSTFISAASEVVITDAE